MATQVSPRTPILIGVGQAMSRWNGADLATAPSPLSLCAEAARSALSDTGAAAAISGAIDVLAVVRTNADSMEGVKAAFPQCAAPPLALAATLGLNVRRAIYSHVGGDQPQALVNEFAEEIFAGNATAVLLTGAEAIAAMKTAARSRKKLDWSCAAEGDMEDRGLGKRLATKYELTNGLGMPTQTYPIFEQALRARLGHDRESYRRLISELWAGFSKVAATHPYAQFPVARTAEFLETASPENYQVADPYLKWHVAQDAVNQGAAVILTSVEKAQEMGVPSSKWIYLHGYANAADSFVTLRPDLSRSRAMELVLTRALASAGKTTDEIALFDLYSCFPCAVLIAAEILGVDWRKTTLTVTGGLPFFGGAGNNYSMHAIATMVERLRETPGAFGLVLANGGFLSKEAAGVYSSTPKADWQPVSSTDLQAAIDNAPAPTLLQENAEGKIASYTVTYRKGTPHRGYVLAETAKGRILARAQSGHIATLKALTRHDPIGKAIGIAYRDNANLIQPSDKLGDAPSDDFMSRTFQYVKLERRGPLLEVIFNRPDQMNALHSAAHFELHEIWDEFESDNDLWVAIVTGAGDRAFSAGNDLKATAKDPEAPSPWSGFGGLCNRFNREKPIIAALNGVAMGGGLEIALSCDLAVADDSARVALPEVKVGLFAAAGGLQRLTRQIGRKAAMEMILTGRHVGAVEAHTLGIVNEVTPKGESLQRARELAEAIMANSPSAVRATKQSLNKLEEREALGEVLKANFAIFDRLQRTKDFKEGITAFAEKRPPRWTNS